MKWKILNAENFPQEEGRVLGCDWYPDNKDSSNFRIDVCESAAQEVWWCGEIQKEKKCLPIFNSIAANIGWGESPYWMEIPLDDNPLWKDFNSSRFDFEKYHFEDVLIKLFNGSFYIGNIDSSGWSPSFSFSRFGFLESIEKWMGPLSTPPYIAPPPLTKEQIEHQQKWSEKWRKRNGLKT